MRWAERRPWWGLFTFYNAHSERVQSGRGNINTGQKFSANGYIQCRLEREVVSAAVRGGEGPRKAPKRSRKKDGVYSYPHQGGAWFGSRTSIIGSRASITVTMPSAAGNR